MLFVPYARDKHQQMFNVGREHEQDIILRCTIMYAVQRVQMSKVISRLGQGSTFNIQMNPASSGYHIQSCIHRYIGFVLRPVLFRLSKFNHIPMVNYDLMVWSLLASNNQRTYHCELCCKFHLGL